MVTGVFVNSTCTRTGNKSPLIYIKQLECSALQLCRFRNHGERMPRTTRQSHLVKTQRGKVLRKSPETVNAKPLFRLLRFMFPLCAVRHCLPLPVFFRVVVAYYVSSALTITSNIISMSSSPESYQAAFLQLSGLSRTSRISDQSLVLVDQRLGFFFLACS